MSGGPSGRPRAERFARLNAVTRAEILAIVVEPYDRPKTRSECRNGPRPCAFAGCRYHLALDVDARTGSVRFLFPDVPIEDMPETCALDVAERGGATLEEVARTLNVVRERVRQIEDIAMRKIRLHHAVAMLA